MRPHRPRGRIPSRYPKQYCSHLIYIDEPWYIPFSLIGILKNKTLSPACGTAFYPVRKLLAVLILALLICNATRGLARRLAGGLALAATAALGRLCNVLGLDGHNSFHGKILHIDEITFYIVYSIIKMLSCQYFLRILKIFSCKNRQILQVLNFDLTSSLFHSIIFSAAMRKRSSAERPLQRRNGWCEFRWAPCEAVFEL